MDRDRLTSLIHDPAHVAAGDLAALSITTDVLLWGGLAVAATGAILTVLLREESGSSVSAACDETGCAAFVTGSF